MQFSAASAQRLHGAAAPVARRGLNLRRCDVAQATRRTRLWQWAGGRTVAGHPRPGPAKQQKGILEACAQQLVRTNPTPPLPRQLRPLKAAAAPVDVRRKWAPRGSGGFRQGSSTVRRGVEAAGRQALAVGKALETASRRPTRTGGRTASSRLPRPLQARRPSSALSLGRTWPVAAGGSMSSWRTAGPSRGHAGRALGAGVATHCDAFEQAAGGSSEGGTKGEPAKRADDSRGRGGVRPDSRSRPSKHTACPAPSSLAARGRAQPGERRRAEPSRTAARLPAAPHAHPRTLGRAWPSRYGPWCWGRRHLRDRA